MEIAPNEHWQRLSEPERVAYLIREIGPGYLGHFDGCICSRFSIRYVDVEISCGSNGERGVWVGSDYQSPEDFAPIMEALREAMTGKDLRGPIEVYGLMYQRHQGAGQ